MKLLDHLENWYTGSHWPTNSVKIRSIGQVVFYTEYIIADQDSTFMSSLMTYLLSKFNIKIRTVAPHNHHFLQAEHGIKSLSTILTKHLTNLGQMWPKYLPLATFSYNTFNTPNWGNYSPYELTYGRKPRPLPNLDSNLDVKVSGTFKEYNELLNKRLKYMTFFSISNPRD